MERDGLKAIIEEVQRILKRGNTAEVKKEKDNIVIVEIERHARIKVPK